MERDKFMDAEEAKNLGLIDTVLVSPPKVGKAEAEKDTTSIDSSTSGASKNY